MLSAAQIKKYGRRWGAVCQANDWRMSSGRLICAADANRARSEEHNQVWILADVHARRNMRAVTVEDLRRSLPAMVLQHLGKRPAWISTKDLSNTQFTLLLALIGDEKDMSGLLVDPDCLASRLAWDHPEVSQRTAILASIAGAAPVEYVESIAQDRFHTTAWRDQSVSTNEDLRQLLMTLRNRNPVHHSEADENNPF